MLASRLAINAGLSLALLVAGPGAQAAPRVHSRTVVGRIDSTNRDGSVIVVSLGLGRRVALHVDGKTRVKGGALTPGRSVRASVSIKTRQIMMARRIKVWGEPEKELDAVEMAGDDAPSPG